ncbi:MAG: ABC transporter permease [Micromonosporaceae bacterium]
MTVSSTSTGQESTSAGQHPMATGARAVQRVVVRSPDKSDTADAGVGRRRRMLEVGLGIAIPVALLALWQVAALTGWVDEKLYPPPSQIAVSAADLVSDGTLLTHTWISTQRIFWGFLLGSISGVAVGLLMGTMQWLRAALEPMLDALYTIPKLAILPIFISMFGIADAPKIAVIAVTVFFFVWIATMSAVLTVAEGYREAAKTFQATRLQMFRHVLVPAALPEIFVGLRISAGISVLILVAAESVVGADGLGYLIFNSRAVFLNQQMFVGIVTVSLVGVLFTWIVKYTAAWLTPWVSTD